MPCAVLACSMPCFIRSSIVSAFISLLQSGHFTAKPIDITFLPRMRTDFWVFWWREHSLRMRTLGTSRIRVQVVTHRVSC